MINRVVIVGLGSIGSRHLRIARQLLPESKIKIMRHKNFTEIPLQADGCISTALEMKNFSPELAIIANPAPFHVSSAGDLLAAGAHLLIEKPISNVSADLPKLILECKISGRILATGYNLRFSPSLRKFRELLHAGIIGNIFSVRCEVGQNLADWRPGTNYRDGVTAQSKLGGGVLLELSHEIDYLRWIFGDVTWIRATLSKQGNFEIDVEDTAHMTIGFSTNDSERELIGTLNMDFVRMDQTRYCIAIGESGSLEWNGVTGEVSIFLKASNSKKLLYQHIPIRDETYIAEWEDILNAIEKSSNPFVSGEDGLRVIEIIEAARISSLTGAQIDVKKSIHTISVD